MESVGTHSFSFSLQNTHVTVCEAKRVSCLSLCLVAVDIQCCVIVIIQNKRLHRVQSAVINSEVGVDVYVLKEYVP